MMIIADLLEKRAKNKIITAIAKRHDIAISNRPNIIRNFFIVTKENFFGKHIKSTDLNFIKVAPEVVFVNAEEIESKQAWPKKRYLKAMKRLESAFNKNWQKNNMVTKRRVFYTKKHQHTHKEKDFEVDQSEISKENSELNTYSSISKPVETDDKIKLKITDNEMEVRETSVNEIGATHFFPVEQVPMLYPIYSGEDELDLPAETFDTENPGQMLDPLIKQVLPIADAHLRESNQCIVKNFLTVPPENEHYFINVHMATFYRDKQLFTDQLSLRKLMSLNLPFPILDTTPFINFIHAMKSSSRCLCRQCNNNLKVLTKNAKTLATFTNIPKIDLPDFNEGEESEHLNLPLIKRISEPSNLPLKKRINEHTSLPLKKRKSLNTCGDDQLSYPATPMLSIAALPCIPVPVPTLPVQTLPVPTLPVQTLPVRTLPVPQYLPVPCLPQPELPTLGQMQGCKFKTPAQLKEFPPLEDLDL